MNPMSLYLNLALSRTILPICILSVVLRNDPNGLFLQLSNFGDVFGRRGSKNVRAIREMTVKESSSELKEQWEVRGFSHA
jgi:hypothetical protein